MSKSLVNEFAELMGDFYNEIKEIIYKYAPYDKTFKGRIIKIKNPRKYVVDINGQSVTTSAHEDYHIDDWVWVTYPMNSVQNAFIVCKTQ